MNQKLITLLAAAAVTPFVANAEIELAEGLALSGYIDMAATNIDFAGDTSNSAIAELELDLSFTSGDYFAVSELSFRGDSNADGDQDFVFETVVVGWNITDELSVSAGNILSYLGWETYDSTGLYQVSNAYRGFSSLYPAYAVGASIDYVTDQFSVGVWVGDSTNYDVSVEVAAKYYGVEGLTLFVAYADDPAYETFNTWASYEMDAFTFALEYVDSDLGGTFQTKAYLAMVNYAADDFGLTLRYSLQEDSWNPEDWKLFTISPSYTFSDNLLGLIEYSIIDDNSFGADWAWAVELIYTF